MNTEPLFRTLNPPPGGLQRLQHRLHGPRLALRWLPATATAAVMVAVGSYWYTAVRTAPDPGISELRQILEAARQPPVSIDGREPARLEVDSERAIVYWQEEE